MVPNRATTVILLGPQVRISFRLRAAMRRRFVQAKLSILLVLAEAGQCCFEATHALLLRLNQPGYRQQDFNIRLEPQGANVDVQL